VTFFALAYALSWWPWLLYPAGLSPSPVIGCGPFLAAVVVLAYTSGRAGVGGLLRRMVRWRVEPAWYAVALLLPIAVASTAAGLNILLGAPAPAPAQLAAWPSVLATFALLILIPGIGGTWEEPGSRGYAQPELQARHSVLSATLIVAGLWAGWHLPLFLTGKIPWSDSVLIVAVSAVFTWLLNGTYGSVLIAMLFHTMMNAFGGAFIGPMFTGADFSRYSWLQAGVWSAVALLVIVISRPARGRVGKPAPAIRLA
jgi:membrane protease YdiL (CAAX protease family)